MAEKTEKLKKQDGDLWIVVLTAALSIFGLIMVFSSSFYYSMSKFGNPQHYLLEDAKWMALGWFLFIVASNTDYRIIRPFAKLILFVGMVLLVLIYSPLGKTINNATRWIDLKVITIMPGEVIKTCLIIYLARFYADDPERINVRLLPGRGKNKDKPWGFKTLLPLIWVAALMGACFFLIYKQPNFSTAGIVVMLIAGMMFAAGLSWILVVIAGTGGSALVFLLYNSPAFGDYMKERVSNFTDPFADPLGSGYQVVQGLLAMGSGGVTGVGLGQSIQKTLYLPEPMNDFILAIIGEELGFVGIICLIMVYVALIWRVFRVALRCRDLFGMLLASGVGMHLALQVILNIAVVTASFPATGVVLPLVSLGGNATILMLAELGMVMNISRRSAAASAAAKKRAEEAVS